MNPLARILLCLVLAAGLSALGGKAYATGGGDASGGSRSLTLEDFVAEGEDVVVFSDCKPGGVSTVAYRATGVATGPYPGPFTAEGVLTIGPQVFPGQRPVTVAGPVLSFVERFTIISGPNRVTGTKTLQPAQPIGQSQGTCHEVTNVPLIFPDASGTIVEAATQARYQASIREPGGTFRDTGDALFSLSEIELAGSCPTGTCSRRIAGFTQTLFSDPPAPGGDDDESED